MVPEDDWRLYVERLRAGDEAVVAAFCNDYGRQLERLAARYLAPELRRRVGPETVVQSACCSFLRRARAGEYRLEEAEDLWRLMCAITLYKVREKVRYHQAQRREVDREVGETTGAPGAPTELDRVTAPEPGPDEAAIMAEEFQRLVSGLDDDERRIVELKLQDATSADIADELGRSERTVRRLLSQLRDRLERELEVA